MADQNLNELVRGYYEQLGVEPDSQPPSLELFTYLVEEGKYQVPPPVRREDEESSFDHPFA